jgi:hypothetical protein
VYGTLGLLSKSELCEPEEWVEEPEEAMVPTATVVEESIVVMVSVELTVCFKQ